MDEPEGASSLAGRREPLTQAERAVLSIVARGVGVRATAAELGVTEREVRVHLASAVRKLRAASVLEALIVAVRRGDIRRPVRD